MKISSQLFWGTIVYLIAIAVMVIMIIGLFAYAYVQLNIYEECELHLDGVREITIQ